MSYTRPLGNAANAQFGGAYTRPAGNAADASFQTVPTGTVGTGAGTLTFTGAATAAHGITGTAAGALAFTGSAAAAHGISATGAGAIGFTGACVALHLRYEVRGEVRMGGILVNRRVRCYKRSTGELTGQADTAAGLYRVHAGFDDAEVYTLAIHMDEAATDWIPPTANRLVPVLADDTA